MRATLARYFNDLVSLVVLALMSIALIAAQAGATLPAEDANESAPTVLAADKNYSLLSEGE